MAGEGNEPLPNPTCVKCDGATELLTYIPRFGDRPAYRFFECTACKAMQWIAEKIGEP